MHTILLVEDDMKIATLLKELLERYDFRVVVEDGEEMSLRSLKRRIRTSFY